LTIPIRDEASFSTGCHARDSARGAGKFLTGVGSGVATCLLMIIAFMTAYFRGRHEPAAAFLFTTALLLLTISLMRSRANSKLP